MQSFLLSAKSIPFDVIGFISLWIGRLLDMHKPHLATTSHRSMPPPCILSSLVCRKFPLHYMLACTSPHLASAVSILAAPLPSSISSPSMHSSIHTLQPQTSNHRARSFTTPYLLALSDRSLVSAFFSHKIFYAADNLSARVQGPGIPDVEACGPGGWNVSPSTPWT